MTDTTIPPLTEADVKALGFFPFGFERDDRMGGVLAHKDGEAWYMQRRRAFWSIDPEYGNMRGALCEDGTNGATWSMWRTGCSPRLIVGTDVLLWRVSDLPADRVERLFNHDTIAPVLAGLKAQAEAEAPQNAIGIPGGHWDIISGSTPTKRRPLVVGDRVLAYRVGNHMTFDGIEETVTDVRRLLGAEGTITHQVRLTDKYWVNADGVSLILPREGE